MNGLGHRSDCFFSPFYLLASLLCAAAIAAGGCSYDSDVLEGVSCDFTEDCPSGAVCEDGICVPGTDAGFPDDAEICDGEELYCNGDCVDPTDNPDHCGDCGVQCEAPEGATPICEEGVCDFQCESGLQLCNGECVAIGESAEHCLDCNQGCGEGEVCSQGSCIPDCPDGEVACNGVCVDIDEDVDHCGDCDVSCEAPEDGEAFCEEGICGFECIEDDYSPCGQKCVHDDDEWYAECDGECVNLEEDDDFCGACDIVCDEDKSCTGGICCGAGLSGCGGECVDTQQDVDHCGGCGLLCDDNPAHSTAICDGGVCDFVCDTGYDECDGMCFSDDDYLDNVEHCGECTNSCDEAPSNAVPICEGGSCGFECMGGFGECEGGCSNFTDDVEHCGECGNSCDEAPSNAVPICEGGSCGFECDTGFEECEGGCIDFTDNVEHCGECANSCDEAPSNATAICDGDTCSFECDSTYEECGDRCLSDDDYLDDPENCGDCGYECQAPSNATAICDGGSCGFSCNEGYRECNGECIADHQPCCDPGYEGDFAGGQGTSTSPYLLCSVDHLNEIGASHLEDAFRLVDDIDASSGVNLIAPYGTSFVGVFDGNGYEIQNLERSADANHQGGLFGIIGPDALITNLTLSGVDVSGEAVVGGLAAVNQGTITGVQLEGSVEGVQDVGGLVGVNDWSGAVSDVGLDVEATANGHWVGGLAGRSKGSITGAIMEGAVVGGHHVGGLVGRSGVSAVIYDSASEANISGGEDVGGLLGRAQACSAADENCNSGEIQRSRASGTVTASGVRSGGLVGVIEGCYQERNTGEGDSHCNSPVVADSYSTSAVDGPDQVGGLVGVAEGCTAVDESIAGLTGTPSCSSALIARTYASGAVDGQQQASQSGGLVAATTGCTTSGSGDPVCHQVQVHTSYWDQETSLQTDSAGGQALSTGAFGSSGNFEGWDFISIWEIATAPDGVQRPILRWE